MLADSDLVINLPLEQVLQEHIASGADLTEVCTAEPGDPSDTYLEMDEQGRMIIEPALPLDNSDHVQLCLSEGLIIGSLNGNMVFIQVSRS